MKNKTFSSRSFLVAAFFLAAALTVEQIFIYLRFYDFDAMLWQHGTPGIVKGLLYILLTLILLFAGAYLYSSRSTSRREDCFDSPSLSLRVVSGFCAVVLVATIVAQIAAIGSFDHLYLLMVSGSTDYLAIASFLHRVTLILAPFACLWFVWIARGNQPSVGLGLLPIVYFMFLTLRVYFDMNTLLTNPRWGFRIITLIFAMLFMLAEVKFLIHKKRSLLHYLFSLPALCILTTSSLCNIIFNISGHFNDGIEVVYYLLEFALAAYIAVRMIMLNTEPEIKEPPAKQIVLVSKASPEQADENGVPADEEATADEADTEELADLTEEEVRSFYNAVTLSIKRRKQLSEPPTPEEEAAIKEESLAIISAVLRTEDRNERISAVRTFLEKAEKANA